MTLVQNTQINLGTIKNSSKDLVVNLSDLSFCMVIGGWASGKSYWLDNIYNHLEEQILSKKLGYVVLNANDGSVNICQKYIIEGREGNECLNTLAEYAELARQRANGDVSKDQHIIVHIEGNDLAMASNKIYLSLIKLLANHSLNANMSLIIVDSRVNALQTPLEITKLCSVITLFSGGNYLPNAKYLKLVVSKLDKFEKQIICNNKTYIVGKDYK